MARIAVAVLVSLVLLSTTVVSADEAKKPPTAGELQAMIRQADNAIQGLQARIAELIERRTRLQGALNYAVMTEKYEVAGETGTCEGEAGECGDEETNP